MLPSITRPLARACLALAALFAGFAAQEAQAQIGSERYSSIVVDSASGNILSSVNADDLRYPASLTKMMTLYMLFEAVRDRRIGLQQYVPVSPIAASMPPTKLGLVPGSLITVEQAILGLVTKSANDAACALGELLGGDEDRFAQMMTVRARALGMTHSQFRNASGLPDWSQVTTARDMAILARHLIQDFPGYYHYFSTPSFVFAGRFVPNHQRLLQTYPGADGLKTGYTEASGYNVVTSALRSDTRLIGVVLGAAHGGERDLHMAALMDQGFDRMGVAAPLIARREPPRMPSIISVAQAAPAYAQPSYAQPSYAPPSYVPSYAPNYGAKALARSPARGKASRPAAPVSIPATMRRAPAAPRGERMPSAALDTKVRVRPAAAQVQVVRPGSTRTAHQVPWSRYPG